MSASITTHKLYLPVFWGALAAPWCWFVWLWVSGDSTAHYLLHPSGKYSTRFLIIAMSATPLRLLFPKAAWTRWLVQSRRHWGVAALAYALLHTVFYFIDEGVLWDIIAGVTKPSFLLGWLALALFMLLGLTSNNRSVKALGSKWKPLQRWVYAAAVLTFLHWVLLDFNVAMGFYHFAPLVLLQGIRVWRNRSR